MNIAARTDNCCLKPTTTLAEIEQLCKEAESYAMRAVCVPPLMVKKAKAILSNTNIAVVTAIGFPFGYSAIEAKLAECVLAIVDGADEIEMLINTCALKNGDWQYLAKEINSIMPIVQTNGRKMTVILETTLLSEPELISCCDIYGAAGVQVIKTSTGFSEKDVSVETVHLLRKHLADATKINAGGFINDSNTAVEMINAGADYISSEKSTAIIKELLSKK